MAYTAFLNRIRITALAIVLASAVAGGACAQTGSSGLDDALLAARTAVQTGNWDILRSLIPRLQGHMLGAYPQYWWLRQQLNDPRKPLPEAELQEFVSVHRGTYLAERLRGECDIYVDSKLAEFEEFLNGTLRSVNRGRHQLRTAAGTHDYATR